MKLHPHINFGGRCEAAFHFYQQCLGGKIVTMKTWGDSPLADQVPAEFHTKICHASLVFGDYELAGVDEPFEPYEPPKGFQILLEVDTPAEAERVYHRLAENGTVKLAMHKSFWSPAYGSLTDQFGVPWEITSS